MNGVFCTLKPLAAGFTETESMFSCASGNKISVIKPAVNAFTYHIIDHEGKEGFLVLTLKEMEGSYNQESKGSYPYKNRCKIVPL